MLKDAHLMHVMEVISVNVTTLKYEEENFRAIPQIQRGAHRSSCV